MEPKRWELHVDDEGYPEALRDISDIAPVIYGIGDPEALSRPCISIVGARRATPYGLAIAKMAASIAVECGVCVVSGGAMGCDRAAGEAALEAGGRTVVVAGCGADIVYPKSSARLFREASERGGAVISLEGWGSEPRRYAFPKRNNVIAALSTSLLVTEAGMPSGTFTTATAAANLGRNVYAAPGSIFSPNSAGATRLIETGALIIVDELSLKMRISMDYRVLRLDSNGAV
ncbi:MAG: DNA-protecting protein DprA, partial [Atopobiaceae bacterium]|nr:DNA-protecting protein DprA [Atopobiaceae bacterium]